MSDGRSETLAVSLVQPQDDWVLGVVTRTHAVRGSRPLVGAARRARWTSLLVESGSQMVAVTVEEGGADLRR